MEISIVIPFYNCAEEFTESIESILNQTFIDFELILISDGATESAIEIAQRYEYDNRVKILYNKHNFIDSLNLGLVSANGKYIARMDSDDIMMPERLQIQYDIMEKHNNIAVCASRMIIFGEYSMMWGEEMSGIINNPLIQMLNANIIPHPTVMIRKAFIDEHKLLYEHEYKYAEDYRLWFQIAKQGGVFWIAPHYLLKYRTSTYQISNNKTAIQEQKALQIKQEILDYLINNVYVYDDDLVFLYGSVHKIMQRKIISNDKVIELFKELFSAVAESSNTDKSYKNMSELHFWHNEISQYVKWFNSNIDFLYNTISPDENQKIFTDNLITSAILTWTELHQKPKYLADLQLSSDVFRYKKVLDVGAGPIPSATCFDDCYLYALDPLHHKYRLIGFPQHLYPQVNFIDSSAEDIPMEDNFFDVIISVNAIDHVDNLEAVANELSRVAKDDVMFAMHVHYHKSTVCEPIEINDSIFRNLFSWVRNLTIVDKSQNSFSGNVDDEETKVLWRNF